MQPVTCLGSRLADAKRGKTCDLRKCRKTDATVAKHGNHDNPAKLMGSRVIYIYNNDRLLKRIAAKG